jgi:hypothetical protein
VGIRDEAALWQSTCFVFAEMGGVRTDPSSGRRGKDMAFDPSAGGALAQTNETSKRGISGCGVAWQHIVWDERLNESSQAAKTC